MLQYLPYIVIHNIVKSFLPYIVKPGVSLWKVWISWIFLCYRNIVLNFLNVIIIFVMNNILLSSLGRVSTLLIWAQRVPIIVLPLGPRMRDWYSYRRYAMMCTCECFVLCIFALCMVVRWANTLFTLRVLWLSYSALWCLWNFVSILWNVFCYVSCFINKAKSWDMTILRFNMIVCICYLICKSLEHFCKPCKAWRKNFFYKITCNALIEVITCF